MITIRDVAKASGFSVTTVSRIFSGDPDFHASPETKQKILDTANELGYSYKSRKHYLNIGCVMSITYSYSDPYFIDILSGIQSFCDKHNASISLIISYAQCQELSPSLQKRIQKLDGLIITELPKERVDYFKNLGKKIVFVDNPMNGYCSVGFDVVYANELIMRHLIKRGYKRIAYIGGPTDENGMQTEFDSSYRLMVYRETLRKANITYDPSIIFNCMWDTQQCVAILKSLFSANRKIDAIFAGSDSLATVIIRQLNTLSIRCPEDIGVVGFNDIEVSKDITPSLTTVHLPTRDMGETAAKILISQITENTVDTMHYLLPVKLVVRESTK